MNGAGSGTPNPFYGLLCFYRYKPERSVWGESTFFGLLWFLSRILSKGGFPVEGDRPLLGRMEGGTAGGPFFVFRSLPVFGRRAAMPALFRFRGRPGRQRKPAGRPFPGRGGKNPPSGRRSHFPRGERHPGAVPFSRPRPGRRGFPLQDYKHASRCTAKVVFEDKVSSARIQERKRDAPSVEISFARMRERMNAVFPVSRLHAGRDRIPFSVVHRLSMI